MESVKQYIDIVHQCAIKGTKTYQYDRYNKHYDRKCQTMHNCRNK